MYSIQIQMSSQPNQENIIDQYDHRLKNLPQVNAQVAQEITKYGSLIQDQTSELSIQEIKIKALESQLLKIDKLLEKTENETSQLSSAEQKNTNKEKRYLMQIDNYNKKIESNKASIASTQKSIVSLKKEIKNVESSTATLKSEKNKVEQILTKEQIKINSLTQNLNDLKLKIMEHGQGGKSKIDINSELQKDEKQIGELFNAIKKQMALIDVLKRQKVHLVASTVFRYCEEDFQKVLEMNKEK